MVSIHTHRGDRHIIPHSVLTIISKVTLAH